jgi:phage baseplate assembly protein gpV
MDSELPRSQFSGRFLAGRVSSVDAKRHTAQVKFDEIDGFVSWDLQVVRGFAADYCLPAKDTPVLCLILDGRLGVGYVLGGIYTESDAAPLDDAGKRAVVGDDLRLGAADAADKVALAPKVKSDFDKIKDEFTTIQTTLASLTGGVTTTAVFSTPYAAVGYSPSDPAAEKVSAK